jgi:hypothetical protein
MAGLDVSVPALKKSIQEAGFWSDIDETYWKAASKVYDGYDMASYLYWTMNNNPYVAEKRGSGNPWLTSDEHAKIINATRDKLKKYDGYSDPENVDFHASAMVITNPKAVSYETINPTQENIQRGRMYLAKINPDLVLNKYR